MKKIVLVLFLSLLFPFQLAAKECVPGGCSGELCIDASQADRMVTTCQWQPHFQCYKKIGVCEEQAQGKCGWTKDNNLQACMKGSAEYSDLSEKHDR